MIAKEIEEKIKEMVIEEIKHESIEDLITWTLTTTWDDFSDLVFDLALENLSETEGMDTKAKQYARVALMLHCIIVEKIKKALE